MTDWGIKQGPDDRVFVHTDEDAVEVENLLTHLYGNQDWTAWFQVGDRWVRQLSDGTSEWRDNKPENWP